MLRTSPSFKRGLLAGALLLAAFNSVLMLLMPSIPVVTPELRMLAAANLLVCVSGGIFLYNRERRGRAPPNKLLKLAARVD
jgi:hypothetical protein